MSFSVFDFAPSIAKAIAASGYTTPTPVQEQAIPHALAGRDITACAPTGTGKTASFALPILNLLETKPPVHVTPPAPQPAHGHTAHRTHSVPSVRVRALVLVPTRELALQIEKAVSTYGKFTRHRALAIYGGVSMERQIMHLRRGIDIVAATPGRLIDHLDQKLIDLSAVEILVIDEADRMFDMGFVKDVRKIIAKLPVDRQTMLFSATMTPEVRQLASGAQRHPVSVAVGAPSTPVTSVKQEFIAVIPQAKLDLLVHLINHLKVRTMLVFSRTKHGADRIAKRLDTRGIAAATIHSNRSQAQRERALEAFRQGRVRVLVATDIAARGIDVQGVSHVVNFDTPAFAEDYIHRIGRTGRASATGVAYTFVSGEEARYVRAIEKLTGQRADIRKFSGFDAPEIRNDDVAQERQRRVHPFRKRLLKKPKGSV